MRFLNLIPVNGSETRFTLDRPSHLQVSTVVKSFELTLNHVMNIVQKLKDAIRYILVGSTNRKYPDSYEQELLYQCQRIAPIFCVFGAVGWLPYLGVDARNAPGSDLMLALRLGITPVSLLCLMACFIIRSPRTGLWAITLISSYACIGAVTSVFLTSFNAAYIGGFFMIICAGAVMLPVPLRFLYSISTCAFAYFLLVWKLVADPNSAMQAYSFQDFGTAIIIVYGFGYLQNRIRRTHYQRAKQVEEQKQIIEEKESQANSLLLNILPPKIAEELKISGQTRPVRIESATVIFTDFVGFTRISESLTPEAVVEELDKCFSYFDQVTEKYRLEKIKTIGDSFMCAGGLPQPNVTHAVDCCMAALEIQAFMKQMKEIKQSNGFDYWELRLGINTGPLVAGVVGHKKFAYDVWGDTVNTASRMESSGVPGHVNISQSTYELVGEYFECEYRGKVKAKNKGEIDMYFLKCIKPDLSIDGEGKVPNVKMKTLCGI